MGEAFADMLPYTIGLLVSPFPIVAVVALLVSDNGRAKTSLFEVTWLLVGRLVLLGLTALFTALGATLPPREHHTPQSNDTARRPIPNRPEVPRRRQRASVLAWMIHVSADREVGGFLDGGFSHMGPQRMGGGVVEGR